MSRVTSGRALRKEYAAIAVVLLLLLESGALTLQIWSASNSPAVGAARWLPTAGTTWFENRIPTLPSDFLSLSTALTDGLPDDSFEVTTGTQTLFESIAIAQPDPLAAIPLGLTAGSPYIANRILVAADGGIEVWGATTPAGRLVFSPRPLLIPAAPHPGDTWRAEVTVLLQSPIPQQEAIAFATDTIESSIESIDVDGCVTSRTSTVETQPSVPSASVETTERWCPGLGRVSWTQVFEPGPNGVPSSVVSVTSDKARELAGPLLQGVRQVVAKQHSTQQTVAWRRDMFFRGRGAEQDTVRLAPSVQPVSVGGLVIDFGRRMAGLTAVDTMSRLVTWQLPLAQPARTRLGGDAVPLMVSDSTGTLLGVQSQSGYVLWRVSLPSPITGLGQLPDGDVLAICWNGSVLRVSPTTGFILEQPSIDGQVLAIAPFDTGFAAVSVDGKLTLISGLGIAGPSVTLTHPPSGSLGSSGNRLVIGTDDGRVLLVDTGLSVIDEVDVSPIRYVRLLASADSILMWDGNTYLNSIPAALLKMGGAVSGLAIPVVSAAVSPTGWVVQSVPGGAFAVDRSGIAEPLLTALGEPIASGPDALPEVVGHDLWISDRLGLTVAVDAV